MAQWDGWQELAQKANIRIMFGLNYLGMAKSGKWDPKNAKELIKYTYSKFGGKPPVFGFELGNELSARGPKAEDVVTGFQELRSAIQSLSLKHPPKIAGPACGNGGPSNPAWIQKFLTKGGAKVIDVATYHWYGVPSTDKHLTSEVLTTKWMAAEVTKAEQTKKEFDSWAPGVPLWQGEGALSALSGQHGLTDRFEDTLWYIVRLGALAANGHSVWNRQTLIGGYYSMFDHRTLRPHPDWWAAVLHKRLMGYQVLSASSAYSNIFSFAHCTKGNSLSDAVTVALVNIASSEQGISFSGIGSSRSRDEYCLTSSKLDSNAVKLNGGADLEMADDGSIPELHPRRSSMSTFLMPGHSVCFVTLRDAAHTACMSGPTPPAPPSPVPSPPVPPGSKDTLRIGEILESGARLESRHGQAQLSLQSTDGNLVLRNAAHKSLWSTRTSSHPKDHLTLQSDGNLVLRDGETVLWASGKHSGATKAVVTDQCNLEVQDSAGAALWSTGTNCQGSSVEAEILV